MMQCGQRVIRGFYCLTAIVLIYSNTFAFDGNRKGFVIGGGFGFAPLSNWTSEFNDLDFTKVGRGGNGFIGYAWNNKDIIAFESIISIYHVEELYNSSVVQSLDGLRWYHYFGEGSGSFFTAVGIGRLTFDTDVKTLYGTGLGYLVGGGIELFKHIQVGIYYYGSENSNKYDVKSNHNVLSIVATAVAY